MAEYLMDPQADKLKSFSVGCIFPKNKSRNFAETLTLARGADLFEEFKITENKTLYIVGFGPKRLQLALAVVESIWRWRDVQIYFGGQYFRHPMPGIDTLHCYNTALKCSDRRAHCWQITSDPSFRFHFKLAGASQDGIVSAAFRRKKEVESLDEWIIPCRLIHAQFKIEKSHPASAQDQLEAEAIRNGIAFCPFFDKTKLGPVG